MRRHRSASHSDALQGKACAPSGCGHVLAETRNTMFAGATAVICICWRRFRGVQSSHGFPTICAEQRRVVRGVCPVHVDAKESDRHVGLPRTRHGQMRGVGRRFFIRTYGGVLYRRHSPDADADADLCMGVGDAKYRTGTAAPAPT